MEPAGATMAARVPPDRPTWGEARAALAGLPDGARGALALLLFMPLLPPRDLARLDGNAGRATAWARLAALREAGLARPVALRPGIASATREVELWHLTDLGLAVAALRFGREPRDLARRFGAGRAALLAALAAPLPRLALYELAGHLAVAGDGYPYLVGWERPWRGIPPADGDARRPRPAPVRLPARLILRWAGGPGEADRCPTDPVGDWLLLPDDPALPPRRWGDALARLAAWPGAGEAAPGRLPGLLVAARGGARRARWEAFLDATWGAARPWPARALDLDNPGDLPAPAARPLSPLVAPRRALARRLGPRAEHRQVPRPVGGDLAPDAPALALGAGDWACLAAHADHPFLTPAGAAALLGLRPDRVRARRDALTGRGLLRVVPAGEVAAALPRPGATGEAAAGAEAARRRRADRVAAGEPAEVTATGLALLAGWWGLTVPEAVCWRGVAGGGPDAAAGRRDQLLGMPEHTLGADALMAGLADAARRAGGELQTWHGPARAGLAADGVWPDAYGVCRRGATDWHFWLEYDRARERFAAWTAKLGRYHRLRERWLAADGAALRAELPVWPRLLVVTQADKDEATIADAALAAARGRGRTLDLLLSTAARVAAAPEGLLGAIWRRVDGDGNGRVRWQVPVATGRPFRGTVGREGWQARRDGIGCEESAGGERRADEDLGRLMRLPPGAR